MSSEIQRVGGNGGGQIMGAADVMREAELRELVRRSVFPKSTDDELSLYMHDCQRQGCHPLDRLIHPTIRIDRKTGERRYTPVTSIDLMRSRADETGQYAGNDEPVFDGKPGQSGFTATVTVWKIVGGVRCPFPGTARWDEYYPGDEQGFMWRSKPHVMLGKVAEARALRKGFPRQLARLYEKSELDRVADGWADADAVVPARLPSATVVPPSPSGATVRPSPARAPEQPRPPAPVEQPQAKVEAPRASGTGPMFPAQQGDKCISEPQGKRLWALFKKACDASGVENDKALREERMHDWLMRTCGVEHLRDVTWRQNKAIAPDSGELVGFYDEASVPPTASEPPADDVPMHDWKTDMDAPF